VRSVAEHVPDLGTRAVHATVSVGGSVFGADCGDAADVIAAADAAMYDAKELGRNRSIVRLTGSRAMEVQTRTRVTWAERIREALASDAFTLYVQPIIDLTGAQPLRYEVLVRMLDRDGGVVAPGSFLQVAERFDLVQRIDRWVARTAIRTLSEVAGSTRFHVNLSAKSLRDGDLLALVERELSDTGVDPDRVVFEITETAAVANLEESRSFAERLRGLGCGFALDDFGTGFSSFYYLKHLPVDVVKIDGDFVRELPRSRIDQIVVSSVVGIAAELGCTTVGEFVEDEQTLRLLRDYGVEHAQGYHCGRPRPLSEFLAAAPGELRLPRQQA
jgi:EAL domain-containing protein (putative c-di-GMP-specific phosphodiesterase class I)